MRAAAVRGPQPQAGHLPGHHQQAGGTVYVNMWISIVEHCWSFLLLVSSDLLSE